MKFGTKVEIFSQDATATAQSIDDSHQVNQSQSQQQRPESSASEEENRKMYTALLQNQVLGIDNPYLLHEIHNSDEMCQKDGLYSYQMQRQEQQENPEFGEPEPKETS